MENKRFIKAFLPVLLLFIATNGIFLTVAGDFASRKNIDMNTVIGGNLILFIATGLSFLLYFKALRNNNVQAFLRLIYGGMFLKMMICLFAVFLYVMVAGKAVNKGAIIVCLILYLVYSFIEVMLLLKQSKQRKNA